MIKAVQLSWLRPFLASLLSEKTKGKIEMVMLLCRYCLAITKASITKTSMSIYKTQFLHNFCHISTTWDTVKKISSMLLQFIPYSTPFVLCSGTTLFNLFS